MWPKVNIPVTPEAAPNHSNENKHLFDDKLQMFIIQGRSWHLSHNPEPSMLPHHPRLLLLF